MFVQASDGQRSIFRFYGERYRPLTGAQFNKRRDLAAISNEPITLHQWTSIQILKYIADFDLIADKAAK